MSIVVVSEGHNHFLSRNTFFLSSHVLSKKDKTVIKDVFRLSIYTHIIGKKYLNLIQKVWD